MFRKTCFKCGSSSVNILKSRNGWQTMHQFCQCGADQTQHSVLKAKRTRNSRKIVVSRSKTRKTRKPSFPTFVVILWGIIVSCFLAFTAYAQMSEPVEYVASSTPKIVQAQTPSEVPSTLEEPETIPQKIKRISTSYGVNSKEIAAIIHCETAGTSSTTIQSTATGRRGRELSFGLAQIHISAHKNVSYEQAIDPDFAIDFLARHWKAGHRSMWFNCSKKLGYL